jgi:hypothetical protein
MSQVDITASYLELYRFCATEGPVRLGMTPTLRVETTSLHGALQSVGCLGQVSINAVQILLARSESWRVRERQNTGVRRSAREH